MKKSEKTRQLIIEKSAPLFNTKGLSGTAISDVLAATQMAKGGLYGHFESKDALAYAVVDYNLHMLQGKVAEAISRGVSAKDKLFAFLDLFSTPTHFPVNGGCPILNFGTEVDDTDPVLRRKLRDTIISAQKKIADIINRGKVNGELKENFDAREFSIKMFSLIEGATLIGRLLETNEQMATIIDVLKKEINQYSS